MIDLTLIVGFEWDAGNARKNEKNGVSMAETEQVFFNQPLLLLADAKDNQDKPRFHALGKSHAGRRLHITFTVRTAGSTIRVVSVRDMHRTERACYESQST